jgi:murein DD-endopeptidase MepM/ murein hydrolase activator NlpD
VRLGRFPSPAPAAAPSGGSWSLEVQIHPGDIRRRVRYLFLSRRQLTLASVVAVVYLAGIALAAAVAPGVVGGLTNRDEYQRLIAERTRQGERLQALVDHVGRIDRRAADLDLRMEKVFLAYGLPPVRPRGKSPRPSRPTAASGSRSIYAGTVEQGTRLRTRLLERLDALDGALDEVSAFEGAHPEQVRATPAVGPLRGSDFVLVSGFGPRRSPFTHELERHTGVDLAAPAGTPVHATADGVVAFAGELPPGRSEWWRLGNLVIVENGDGFVTLFGHAERLDVKTGQRVRRGDRLATVGSSGWSSSPHLYYEVRRKQGDGKFRPVDPLIYILDHRWPNEEQLLLKARAAPPPADFEPLPLPVGGTRGPKRSKEGR